MASVRMCAACNDLVEGMCCRRCSRNLYYLVHVGCGALGDEGGEALAVVRHLPAHLHNRDIPASGHCRWGRAQQLHSCACSRTRVPVKERCTCMHASMHLVSSQEGALQQGSSAPEHTLRSGSPCSFPASSLSSVVLPAPGGPSSSVSRPCMQIIKTGELQTCLAWHRSGSPPHDQVCLTLLIA